MYKELLFEVSKTKISIKKIHVQGVIPGILDIRDAVDAAKMEGIHPNRSLRKMLRATNNKTLIGFADEFCEYVFEEEETQTHEQIKIAEAAEWRAVINLLKHN